MNQRLKDMGENDEVKDTSDKIQKEIMKTVDQSIGIIL